MVHDVIALTGATGSLGRRLALRLAAEGASQRLIVRDPSRAPRLPGAQVAVADGYADTAAMTAALHGASAMFLVSGRESPDRVMQHVAAIDAAVATGVAHVVYLSFLGAAPACTFTLGRDHWMTEQYLGRRAAESGMRWTALRSSLYHQGWVRWVGADGVLRGPAGTGRVASVSHDDLADVATAVLLDDHPEHHDRTTYDVTGPALLNLDEVAAELTVTTGRPVTYHPETVEEAYESRARYQAPRFEVDGWVTSYTAIASGELAIVSSTVERFAGRPAQTFHDWLEVNPEEWQGLLAR
ncbi:quinone oxidoreductase 2 [mine drainage metagenome]|uniref:Quinone oxidoreductase 2 n=1 Tax=mine drainage metagenome TaxID=410659 RepID=A0A1J5Q1S2_9ZZZZ